MREFRVKSLVSAVLLSMAVGVAAAQTVVTPPKNKYTPAQDVQLGREAAAQADKELKILRDAQTTAFIERIGRRIIDAAPANLQHPEFRYTFKVVDAKEINAFALPGGPTYFNRGMFIAARSEGEVAGVLAHELSHVLLRHGTAQATKATPYEIGTIAGQILGAVVGGRTGAVIAQGSQLGIGAAFLRFSRQYERDADILGAQLMARAGYDPREMANMFRTIAAQGGDGAPEFLSSHPDPGNRYDAVMAEAQNLRVVNPVRDNGEFNNVRQRLGANAMPQQQQDPYYGGGNSSGRNSGVYTGGSVSRPSTRYRTYSVSGAFQVSVPDNWRQLPGQNGATFAPDNAFYEGGFTHGVEIGVAQVGNNNLRDATEQLITSFAQGNPGLRSQGQRNTSVDGRAAIETALLNDDQHGPEVVRIVTTMSANQTLLYAVTVVPQNEEPLYRTAFAQIIRSLRVAR
jgi:Zn-dependent protease with chaperone function